MKLPLKGIIPPVVTPLTTRDKLDLNGLEKLVEHLISGGVHGLFILGTTGEAPSLTYRLRKELIERTCRLVDHRVPVLTGITDTSVGEALEIAECAAGAGADAVVVAPPYYMPIAPSEMVDYLEDLVPKLPLPFLLYNIPSHTKLHIPLETAKKAREMGALGIKDSSGDLYFLFSLIDAFKEYPEFSVFSGTELFIPETILQGGHGAVAGGANMFPRLFVDFYEASLSRDLEKIALLRKDVMKIYNTIYSVSGHSSRYIKGTKCAMSVLGICNDYSAPPLRSYGMTERRLIEKYVEEMKHLITAS